MGASGRIGSGGKNRLNMKKYLLLLAVSVLAVCGALIFFFYRMGTNDAKALADFPAAYQAYDRAVSEDASAVQASNPESHAAADGLARKADAALAKLNAEAAVRISSLTKNDGALMQVMQQIAAISGKEAAALQAYQAAAISGGDTVRLADEFAGLSAQRRAAYARYLELAGGKN